MFRFYLLLFILLTNFANGQETTLPPAKSLLVDAQLAHQNKTPILIMFSTRDCHYCKEVIQEVIEPMHQLEEYKSKIIIRHVDSSSLEPMKDFYNNNTNHGKFSFQNGINFYPTLLIMDDYGAVLEKVVGVSNMEYYWAELDQMINTSIKKIQQRTKAKL